MYPMLPYSINPLADYHSFLRMGAMSGYPNQMLATPHPREMSTFGGMMPMQNMFRYNMGSNPRMNVNLSGPTGRTGPYGLPFPGWHAFQRPTNRWSQSSWGPRYAR